MNTHLDPIAKLCASCKKGVLFQDDQEFLYEAVDGNGNPVLAKSGHTALTVSKLILLQKDTLPGLPSLANSSKEGCDFCSFLQDIISAEDTQDEATRIFGSTLIDMKEPWGISIYIHFRWKNESELDSRGDGLLGAIILLCFDNTDTEITLLCLAEGLTGSEPSDVWLGLATPSSQSCFEKHRLDWMSERFNADVKGEQSQSRARFFVPERLISVEEPSPRLVLRTDSNCFGVASGTPTYAALSYCWGSADDAKQQLTTTTASLAQRQKAIANNQMTEVVKDAVVVTRALKIPYLWIDALCILQDDISDWERQCVDIANLYANASVTICAASSITCQQGFLRQRGLRIRIPFQSVTRTNMSGSYYLQFKYAGLPRGDLFSEEAADAHYNRWGNRGWVFQESFSASRKLLFGNANVHYYSSSSVHSMGSGARKRIDYLALSRDSSQDREEIYKSWAYILHEYSRFEDYSFTKTKDILPALSGLASHYYRWIPDDFHAGLWKGDLFRGLMWYSDGDSKTQPSRQCCIPTSLMRHYDCPVPSWSPLGRGMVVTYGAMYKDDECLASFQPEYKSLKMDTKPAGINPFGEIKNNWGLRVRSHVLDLAMLNDGNLEVADTFNDIGCRGTLVYKGKQVGCFELDFSYDDSDLDFDFSSDSPACMMNEITRFSWVLLGSCKVRNADEPQEKIRRARGACGLILFPVPNSDKFCRVGAFFPGFPENHHDGLFLIRKLGEIKTVTIV